VNHFILLIEIVVEAEESVLVKPATIASSWNCIQWLTISTACISFCVDVIVPLFKCVISWPPSPQVRQNRIWRAFHLVLFLCRFESPADMGWVSAGAVCPAALSHGVWWPEGVFWGHRSTCALQTRLHLLHLFHYQCMLFYLEPLNLDSVCLT
jgi:hypothetical protein